VTGEIRAQSQQAEPLSPATRPAVAGDVPGGAGITQGASPGRCPGRCGGEHQRLERKYLNINGSLWDAAPTMPHQPPSSSSSAPFGFCGRSGVALAVLCALAACATSAPIADGPSGTTGEVVGPHGVVGFRSAHALFYVVPVEGGVVLVDTGFDESGEDLRRAIAGRKVLAVFVTHAHLDHWSGVATVGDVPVYAGAEDADIMRGVREPVAIVQQLLHRLWPRPQLPTDLRPVRDGTVVDVAGARFEARHLPGHTAGSTVWLWRDGAFTGDAFGAPPGLSDDDHETRLSLSRLWGIGATVLLDGHGGRTDDARGHIERILADHEGLP